MPEAVGRATYREFAPPRGLENHVACLWMQRVPPDMAAPPPQLVIPNGTAEIACDLRSGRIVLAGARTEPRRVRPCPGQALVGVRFRPGAVAAALGAGPWDTNDAEVALEFCWGRAGARLGEQLAEAGSVTSALRLLVHVLAARLTALPPADPLAVDALELLQPWSANSVADVSRRLHLSERQLRRRVLAAFGFGPRQLRSLLRFQAFLAIVDGHRGDRIELARLAALLGYADQSHLNRESTRLTGVTPRRLLEELSESCGPDHDHAVSFAALRVRFLQAGGWRPAVASLHARSSGTSARDRCGCRRDR